MTVVSDCTTEWRMYPFRFWLFRRHWHRCTLTARHPGACVCRCGVTAPMLVMVNTLEENS